MAAAAPAVAGDDDGVSGGRSGSPPTVQRRPSFSLLDSPNKHHSMVLRQRAHTTPHHHPPRWWDPSLPHAPAANRQIDRLRSRIRSQTGAAVATTMAAAEVTRPPRPPRPLRLQSRSGVVTFTKLLARDDDDDDKRRLPSPFVLAAAAMRDRAMAVLEGADGGAPCQPLPRPFMYDTFGWSSVRCAPFVVFNEALLTVLLEWHWSQVEVRLLWQRDRLSIHIVGVRPRRLPALAVADLLASRVAQLVRAAAPSWDCTLIVDAVHDKSGTPLWEHPALVVGRVGASRVVSTMHWACGLSRAQQREPLPRTTALAVHILQPHVLTRTAGADEALLAIATAADGGGDNAAADFGCFGAFDTDPFATAAAGAAAATLSPPPSHPMGLWTDDDDEYGAGAGAGTGAGTGAGASAGAGADMEDGASCSSTFSARPQLQRPWLLCSPKGHHIEVPPTTTTTLSSSVRQPRTILDDDDDGGGDGSSEGEGVEEGTTAVAPPPLVPPQVSFYAWDHVFLWNLRQASRTVWFVDTDDADVAARWGEGLGKQLAACEGEEEEAATRFSAVEAENGVLWILNPCPAALADAAPLVLGEVTLHHRGACGGGSGKGASGLRAQPPQTTATTTMTTVRLALAPLPSIHTRECLWRFELRPAPSVAASVAAGLMSASEQWHHLSLLAAQHNLHVALLPLLHARLSSPSWWCTRLLNQAEGHMPLLLASDPLSEELTFCAMLRLQLELAAEVEGSCKQQKVQHGTAAAAASHHRHRASVVHIIQTAGQTVASHDAVDAQRRWGAACVREWQDGSQAWWRRMFLEGLPQLVEDMDLTAQMALGLLQQCPVLNPFCQRHLCGFVTDDPLFRFPPLGGADLLNTVVGRALRHLHFVAVVCFVQVQRALDAALLTAGPKPARVQALLNATPHVTLVHSHRVPLGDHEAVVVGNLMRHAVRKEEDARVDVTVSVPALLGMVNWMQVLQSSPIAVGTSAADESAVVQMKSVRLRGAALRPHARHMGVLPPLKVAVHTWAATQTTNDVLVPRMLAAMVPQVLRVATSFVAWEADALRTRVAAMAFASQPYISALTTVGAALAAGGGAAWRKGAAQSCGPNTATERIMVESWAREWCGRQEAGAAAAAETASSAPQAHTHKRKRGDRDGGSSPSPPPPPTLRHLAPLDKKAVIAALHRARRVSPPQAQVSSSSSGESGEEEALV